jgi:hypothetical protein
MKQQNRCFANSNFELRREVEVILPASAISYTKKQFILFLGRGLFLRPPSSSQHWHPPLHRDLVHHLSPWPSGACRPTRTSARPCGRKRRRRALLPPKRCARAHSSTGGPAHVRSSPGEGGEEEVTNCQCVVSTHLFSGAAALVSRLPCSVLTRLLVDFTSCADPVGRIGSAGRVLCQRP